MIRQWSSGLLGQLVESGWLREVERAKVIQPRCPEHCVVEPHWQTDPLTGKTVGLHFCHEADCGCQEIDPERMRQWEVNFTGIAQLLHCVCGLSTELVADVPGRLCWLGTKTARNAYRDLFLARGLRWSDAQQMIQRARRLRTSPAPAVITLSDLPDTVLWDALPVRPAQISLAESLSAGCDQLRFELAGLFTQRIEPAVEIAEGGWLTVQQAAAQHVSDVDGLDMEKAKARVSAAASRGKFKTNGKKGPSRRIEPTSYAQWRLAERERNLQSYGDDDMS